MKSPRDYLDPLIENELASPNQSSVVAGRAP